LYEHALKDYVAYAFREEAPSSGQELVKAFNVSEIRSYMVHMLDSDPPMSPRTVNLHLSALSGFCTYMMKTGLLKSNPVKLVSKPKVPKRIPQFYAKESMDDYFNTSSHVLDKEEFEKLLQEWHTDSGRKLYDSILERMIISVLYSLVLSIAAIQAEPSATPAPIIALPIPTATVPIFENAPDVLSLVDSACSAVSSNAWFAWVLSTAIWPKRRNNSIYHHLSG
jgi:hypothetical protein